METATLRTSYISDINNVRRKLWETVYSNFESMNLLARCIYEAFNNTGIINRLDFKFENMKIGIDLLRPSSNIEMNTILNIAFDNFVQAMYEAGNINESDYTICSGRTNMLFNLILNTEDKAIITL